MTREHDWRQVPRRDADTRPRDAAPRRSSSDDTTGVRNVRPAGASSKSFGQIFDYEEDAPEFRNEESMPTVTGRPSEPEAPSESKQTPTESRPIRWTAFDIGKDDIDLPPYRSAELGAQLVEPVTGTGGRKTWHHTSNSSLVAHGLLCPKIVGNCEDSPPVFITPLEKSSDSTYLGVFDGMGGAGAGQVRFQLSRKTSISSTEALLASRICWRAAMRRITDFDLHHRDDLSMEIKSRLEIAKTDTSLSEGSRIRGTLTKRLPTTLVVSQVQSIPERNMSRITTWWAGDSRAFLLTPEHGLAAITRDHVRESDQLEQLQTDPPIENVVNQSTDFYLEESIQEVSAPFVLLLATDGVFGYLPTPGFLELGLLEALSNRSQEVANNFATFCTTYAADDVSAVMVVSGFQDDRDIADRFRIRLATLRNQYSQIRTMTSGDPNWNTEVERLWSLERPTYQRLLGGSID